MFSVQINWFSNFMFMVGNFKCYFLRFLLVVKINTIEKSVSTFSLSKKGLSLYGTHTHKHTTYYMWIVYVVCAYTMNYYSLYIHLY